MLLQMNTIQLIENNHDALCTSPLLFIAISPKVIRGVKLPFPILQMAAIVQSKTIHCICEEG